MCIAIYKPNDVNISRETLETCFDANPDGAGFMFTKDRELQIQKGFMSFEDFWKAYSETIDDSQRAVIHFRIRTHGASDEANTHPFRVGDNLGFVHNGIISNIETDKDGKYSDTFHFNEQVLQQLYAADTQFIRKPHIQRLIQGFIGYSKLIFMDKRGRVTIINESKGTWDDDVWYSNTSYRKAVVPAKKYQHEHSNDVPVLSSSSVLKPTDRVEYRKSWNGPVVDRGYLAFFGQKSNVGVVFDSTKPDEDGVCNATIVSGWLVFPEKKETEVFQVGDWVECLRHNNEVGEVVSVHDITCKVNLHDKTSPDLSTMYYIDKQYLRLYFRPELYYAQGAM